ncbi:MAG: CHAP domain-containing protein [Bacteroidota bacterium]|nr:CHAP domain-containing protein [Bacteroidota bacterium]
MKLTKRNKILLVVVLLLGLSYPVYRFVKKINPNTKFVVGQKLDSLNGVYVYYNGGIDNVEERNTSPDGYNIGLKYQCVEFVKRYYYEFYKHKMPDSYGNAKDFFNASVKDGQLNKQRELLQYKNPSLSKPEIGDLIVLDGHAGNRYGHVAIVSMVYQDAIEIIQQNPGPFADSRALYSFEKSDLGYKIKNERVLGWLRMMENWNSDPDKF